MSDHIEKTQGSSSPSLWQALTVDLVQALRFYSRLPLPALAMGVALVLGLGPWLAATLSVAVMTLTTGALHEDGLADTADSFGGATRERRLEIMRDSRIGSYGTAALILAFALRIGALAALVSRVDSSAAFAAVLIAALL